MHGDALKLRNKSPQTLIYQSRLTAVLVVEPHDNLKRGNRYEN